MSWAGFLKLLTPGMAESLPDCLPGTVLSNCRVTIKLVLQVFTTPVKTSSTSATRQLSFPPPPANNSVVKLWKISGSINQTMLVVFFGGNIFKVQDV